ncbi:non-homologous end-joining DNA ligase [Bosea sp. NPDC055594]
MRQQLRGGEMVRRPAPRRVLKAGPAGETLQSALVAPARSGVLSGDLFADPMPARVEPCLALLRPAPPVGPDWAFEVKWDGYRLAVHRRGAEVRIITRGGHDWTHRFPAIAESALDLPAESFILDGEAVVFNDEGRSDFGALQQALGGRGGKGTAHLAVLYAFDLLYLDGHDLMRMSLDERRQMLQFLLAPSDQSIRLSEEVEAAGVRFLEQACEMGLEGIIAKRRSAPYRPGRGGDWLKIKCVQSETFLIVGYEPSPAALGGVGRLLLAAHGNYGLTYVGSVGTGFTQQSARDLRKQLDRLKTAAPPVRAAKKGVVWTKPMLAAEIAFRGWTHDVKLRHASFKGVREKADEVAIYRLG